MSAIATTPPATKAAMIRALLGEKHMKFLLAPTAERFHVPLPDLQAILDQAGYPDQDQMRAAVRRLEAHANTTNTDTTGGADGGGDGEPTLQQVNVNQILPDPDNPRENLTDIDELAASIVEVGLLQPIVVRRAASGRYYVVAGHRRLAAVKMLHWARVSVVVHDQMRPDHVLAAMLIENGQRADLNPIEEARGLNRLKTQLDCSEQDLANRVGRSLSYVNGRLLLLTLSAEEQDAIRQGRLGLTAGTQKARVGAGRLRNSAVGRVPGGLHLSSGHALADRVRSRCTRMQHPKSKSVGGIGCGECWETVIRADERQHLHDVSERRGRCVLCDTHHDPDQLMSFACAPDPVCADEQERVAAEAERALRERLADAWEEGHQRGLRDADLEHVADNPYRAALEGGEDS